MYPILAVNAPADGGILVVEGWLPDYALERVAGAFRVGSYSKIVTTGGIIERGSFLSAYKSYANLARATLVEMGIAQSDIVALATPEVKKDRTFQNGRVLSWWITSSDEPVENITICTLGPHARRSRMLYRASLPDTIHLGVWAIPSEDYDPSRWWRTSSGIRNVVFEAMAYVYAVVFNFCREAGVMAV